MDFSTLVESLQVTLGESLPRILAGLGILILGWLVAVLFRAGIRRSLSLFKVNERVRSGVGGALDLESGIATGVKVCR